MSVKPENNSRYIEELSKRGSIERCGRDGDEAYHVAVRQKMNARAILRRFGRISGPALHDIYTQLRDANDDNGPARP
ncbi:hypothetical protein J7355_08585 [Endozoicomonas sp. G2_2]|nr:hypothetical protein [Endozoicomonas sp. G2_2]